MAELFVDGRGAALRVTWHATDGVVVLSIWRVDLCVGTVRLVPDDVERLAELLHEVRTGSGAA